MREYLDVVYKELADHPLEMDIRVPDEDGCPLIMWIHGGGWWDLRRTWSLIDGQLDRGYAVASVDYSYSDESPFPASIIDLKDAMFFLREHAAEYGFDASKLIVSGDSAGAHLAAMLAVGVGQEDWNPQGKDDSVQAAVLYDGMYELKWEIHNVDTFIYDDFLGTTANSKKGRAISAAASPVTYIDGTEPPILLIHGSKDDVVPIRHPRHFRNLLEEAGDDVHYYLVPGGEHATSGESVDAVVQEFLDYYIKGERTCIVPELEAEHYRVVPHDKEPIRPRIPPELR